VHVDRSFVRRLDRRTGADLIYSGLNGLDGWQTTGNNGWRENGGHLVSDQGGASLFRDLRIPAHAKIEIDLSWSDRPNFELSLAVMRSAKTALRTFAVDVWDDRLVAVCETKRDADVAVLKGLQNGSGGISLHIYLDQQAGRMIVTTPSGESLADLKVPAPNPQTLGGLRLTNTQGNLRLENLRVYKWNSTPPQVAGADQGKIIHADGRVTEGRLVSYDADKRRFAVQTGEAAIELDRDKVQGFLLTPAGESQPQSVRVAMLWGTRISGELVKIDDERVYLRCPGIDEPLSLPIAQMQALSVLKHASVSQEPASRIGRLELAGVKLHGCLIDGREGETTCLVWRPTGSDQGGRLARGVSARIVYRDPDPPKTSVPAQTSRVVVKQFAVGQAVLRQLRASKPEEAPAAPTVVAPVSSPCVLHLRSGDTIPCSGAGVDERGVSFKTTVSDATFVRHDQVKVLELMPNAPPVQIVKSKRDRLLTLPRMQRGSPPTQLIRAVNGDYLRGRLVAMDEKQLQVEVQLETQSIPRAGIARIIWLHADETEPQANKPAQPERLTGTRVQAIPRGGNRLTFYAEELAGSTLSGQSDLLGSCRVDLEDVDELLVGKAIEQAAAALAFHNWRLTPAVDPLEFQEGAAEGGVSDGMDSVLVGKPAPELELDLADGKRFRLAERKGRIVVIDFWASWCGPCLQAMPQVHEVTREFADQQVELVGVNLQESPEQIKAALEKLGLSMAVALDQDGRVAERYGATAIPQTVIVDREGKVARLFVGGGARFGEQLREALESVLSGESKPPEAQP
jgi:thiol-disulfide isomerase/thioredoxin